MTSPPTEWADPAPEPADTADEDLPTSASYVLEYAWDCPTCGETNGSRDLDLAGGVEQCEGCQERVRITT